MTERATKITKAAVDRLAPGEMIWVAEIRGFGVRCQRRDRVYMVKYRTQARQRWYTIGKHGSPWTPELARREAKRVLGLVAEGKDPADRKKKDRSAPTISALADRFLEEHVETKAKDRTYTEYQHLIERIGKPELGRLKVDEVRASDVEKLHLKLRGTPFQANRLLALLSKMFNWSGRRGERNPCVGVERFAEQKRRPTLARMIFCSLVMAVFPVNAEAGRCAPRPLCAQPRLLPQPKDTVCRIKSKLLQLQAYRHVSIAGLLNRQTALIRLIQINDLGRAIKLLISLL